MRHFAEESKEETALESAALRVQTAWRAKQGRSARAVRQARDIERVAMIKAAKLVQRVWRVSWAGRIVLQC